MDPSYENAVGICFRDLEDIIWQDALTRIVRKSQRRKKKKEKDEEIEIEMR